MYDEDTVKKAIGRLEINATTLQDVEALLWYIESLEEMVEIASAGDFFGTEGYKHHLGWD